MARSTIGSLWDRGNRNELNRMLEELYSSVFIFNDGTGFITSKHLADGSVTNSKIQNGAVSESKIAPDAVTNSKISDNSVSNRKIADKAVTNAKIGSRAVSHEEIFDYTITHTKLGTGSVVNRVIADGAVWRDKIGPNAVNNDKLDTVVYGKILEAGTDANNLTTPGIYTVSYNVNATETLNFPPGNRYGVLDVRHNGLDILTQTYTMPATGRIWVRTRYVGSWSRWRSVGASEKGAVLLGTRDLNTILETDTYRQTWSSNVTEALNYPPITNQSKVGVLYVASTDDITGTQMYVADNAAEIWVRNFYQTWGEWKKIGGSDNASQYSIPHTDMEVTGRWTSNESGDKYMLEMGKHELIEVIEAGRSVQDRPIYAAIIGDPSKPAIIAAAGAHGTEVGAVEAAWLWVRELTEEKSLMLMDLCIIVVPNQNPDNRFIARGNKNVVDLSLDWAERTQPETQAIDSLLNDYNVVAYLDMHNFGYPRQNSLRPTAHGPEKVKNNSQALFETVFAALEKDGQPVREYTPQSKEGSIHWELPVVNEIPTLLLEIPCGGYGNWTFDHYQPTPAWQAHSGIVACNAFAHHVWNNLTDFVTVES